MLKNENSGSDLVQSQQIINTKPTKHVKEETVDNESCLAPLCNNKRIKGEWELYCKYHTKMIEDIEENGDEDDIRALWEWI